MANKQRSATTTTKGKSHGVRQAAKTITTKTTPVAKPVKVDYIQTPLDQTTTPRITHKMIAKKAYELWQNRGGSADFNWFEAERILRGAE